MGARQFKDFGVQAVLQTQPNQPLKHALEWGLLASVLLHLALLLGIAKPTFESKIPTQQEITIALPPKPEPPKPEPRPETPKPPEPTPVKPQPVKPLPQKVEPLPLPTKISPEPVAPAPVVEPHPQAVISTKPTLSESKPEVVVPPPVAEPAKVSGPSEGDIDAARNAFRAAAHRELKKNQRYPRIAADRGIEGEVKLSIHLDENGNITGVDVAESSGNNALDEAAVNAAKKSNLKSYFHEILRGRVDNILVTVNFRLAN